MGQLGQVNVLQQCDICNYKGLYSINIYGEIFNNKGTILKGTYDKDGYKQVCLSKNGKTKTYTIHKLVMETFVGKRNGKQINHKNGIKDDNRLENLEYCTQSFNMKHSYNLGLHPKQDGINNKRSIKIQQLSKENKIINIFNSIGEASRKLKIDISSIIKTCKGRQKTSGGFIFKYI